MGDFILARAEGVGVGKGAFAHLRCLLKARG